MSKVYMFSSGSQLYDWKDANCERCQKSVTVWGIPDDLPTCEIELAIELAGLDDGSVSQEIAARAGYTTATARYCWMCPEVEWTNDWKEAFLKERGVVNDSTER